MAIDVTGMRRLSELIDRALELDEPSRDAWLATLEGDDRPLAERLRALLADPAARDTAAFLAPPAFDVVQPPACAAGDIVGPYRVLRELGTGGMATVWLAERVDGGIRRRVALKLPFAGWSPGLAERFARERDILASLEHPNIARLYDIGTDAQGRPYMAMEYVDGQPIDRYCADRALPVRERIALLLQVADAVAFAHSRLVVHRDLKPGNILVTRDGQVRLLDFGIAKLVAGESAQETALTALAGRALSVDYASPEQVRGEAIGTPSDAYSLGVVAFELLAGVKPYRLQHASAAALEAAILEADVPLASRTAEDARARRELRGDLDAILAKALRKSPAERYATVDALAQDWRRYLEGRPVQARRDTLAYRVARFARRHRTPLAAAMVIVLAFALAFGAGATAAVIAALLAGLGAALWQAKRAQDQARNARLEARTAQAMQAFLEQLFRANARTERDPQAARRRTAKELLDEGSARLDDALRDAPEAKFRLLRTLSEMYVDLGEPTRAVELAAQRAALAERLHGAESIAHADALVAWGATLVAAEQHERAREVLVRAYAMIDGRDDVPAPLRIHAELALGELYRYVRDPRGLPHAQRAVELLAHGAPTLQWLDARTLLGAMQAIAGNAAEADAALDHALALAPTLAGAEARLPMIYEEAANVAENRGDAVKAEAMLRAAIDVESRLSGASNVSTVALLRQLARLLTNQGRVREALEVFAIARDRVEAWPDSQDRALLLHLLLSLEARAWTSFGHPERAVPMFDEARAIAASGAAANPMLSAILETSLCPALVELSRLDEARAALDRAAALMREHAIGSPDVRFNYMLAEVRLSLALGDATAALEAWTAYDAAAPPEITAAWRRLLRAEIAWTTGDASGTEANAMQALDRMRQPPAPFGAPRLAMRATELLGRVRLRQRRAVEAVALLADALAQADAIVDPERSSERAQIARALAEARSEAASTVAATRAGEQS